MKQFKEKPKLSRVEREERIKFRNGMYQPRDRRREKINHIIMVIILIVFVIYGIYAYSLL